MNYKQILKDEAKSVHSLLSKYIELHDSILNKSGTFLSTIKNLFNPIDYEDLYNKTEDLVSSFEEKKRNLDSLEANIDDSISPKQKKYLKQLLIFFERLFKTVQLLKKRQYKLFLKSEGKSFSKDEFMQLQKKYENSIEVYTKEGEKLNKLDLSPTYDKSPKEEVDTKSEFRWRWSLYLKKSGETYYAMHENSVIRIVGYVMSFFKNNSEPNPPWTLHLNFNKNNTSFKLKPKYFNSNGTNISPQLISRIEAIDPGYQVKDAEPVFMDLKNNKELKISDYEPGKSYSDMMTDFAQAVEDIK